MTKTYIVCDECGAKEEYDGIITIMTIRLWSGFVKDGTKDLCPRCVEESDSQPEDDE